LEAILQPDLHGKLPLTLTHKGLLPLYVQSTTSYDLSFYTTGSGRRMLWKCPNNAEHGRYLQIINRRVKSFDDGTTTQGCPFCRGVKAWSGNNLACIPELVAQWDWHSNGMLKPHEVACGSAQTIHWTCNKGIDHRWATPARDRTRRGHGCPFCKNKRVSITNCLATVAPQLAKEIHPTKNDELNAQSIIARSTREIVWICNACQFEWTQQVRLRLQPRSKCPGCRRRPADIPGMGHPQ
jgi:hypothetical protein